MNPDEAWNDTGDELALTPPCSPTSGIVDVMATKDLPRTPSLGTYHPSAITTEVSPFPSHSPGVLREGWSAREHDENLGRDRSAARLDRISHGNHQQMWGTENLNGRAGRLPHRTPNNYRSPGQSPGHFEVRDSGRMSLKRLQEAAVVKAGGGKRFATERSEFAKALVVGGGRTSEDGSGLGERCLGWATIQGYCNWLLDRNGPRVRLLAYWEGSKKEI